MLSCMSGIGIIIELKFDQTAGEGLKQIISNKYKDSFTNVEYNLNKLDVQYSVLIGLNMLQDQKIRRMYIIQLYKFGKYFPILNNTHKLTF